MPDFAKWFAENLWSGWAGLALILACAEMLTLDLTLLMLASGAAAGAVTALILPGQFAIQVIVAASVAVLMLFLLRPTLLARVRSMPGYKSRLERLVGSSAVVTKQITADDGEVKLDGQVWRARPVDPMMVLPAGHLVEVYEVDGITLVVYPQDRQIG